MNSLHTRVFLFHFGLLARVLLISGQVLFCLQVCFRFLTKNGGLFIIGSAKKVDFVRPTSYLIKISTLFCLQQIIFHPFLEQLFILDIR